jgi:threonyl-tRNA synthetase
MFSIKTNYGVFDVREGQSFFDVAVQISDEFSKTSLGVSIDGFILDLYSNVFTTKSEVKFILKNDEDKDALDLLRHSCAHLFANALSELYPEIKINIGPVIENGFYYDFDLEYKITESDFEKIEKKMKELAKKNSIIKKFEIDKKEALEKFKNNEYKLKIINKIDENDKITFYQQGDFFDLCRGPHIPNTRFLRNFKLLSVSGAYVDGDSKNKMLQRVYGTAFFESEAIEKHLTFLEEVKRKDHRKIGKSLDLFHQQSEAKGDIFWHDKGTRLYQTIVSYIREKLKKYDYQEVMTPIVVDRELWERSGHYAKFSENMIFAKIDKEEIECALKPMNCPCHVQIFNHEVRSYKELPIRMSEFGRCHRFEPSGSLYGIMRLRSFVQDDAHIFCTPSQIKGEVVSFIKLVKEVYADFGFNDFKVKFSDRPQVRAGDELLWDKAEEVMLQVLDEMKIDYSINKGEGAFYGPKYEFVLKDAIGRDWQCGTLQLDFVLPERLDAKYVTEKNTKENVVMLHRAVLGAIERFIGILLENTEGRLPLWLAPVKVCIIGTSNNFDSYIHNLKEKLEANNIYTESDISSETVAYKRRKAEMKKVPFIVTIGQKEVENNNLFVRNTQTGEEAEMKFEDFLENFYKKS